jgi:uncharacterized integral membrane protein
MTKRIFLYGGSIIFVLGLFLIFSDRYVTERVPLFATWWIRLIVIFALSMLVGRLLRPLFRRGSGRVGAL